MEARIKEQRFAKRDLDKTLDEKENYIKAFQSAGYFIGEVVNI